MTTITSIHNARIKWIRSLAQRRERERSACFFVEGIRPVAEAIRSGVPIETLIVAPQLMTSPQAWEIFAALHDAGTPILDVSVEVFETLAAKDVAQGIAAVVRQRWKRLDQIVPGAEPWIALEGVQYPGNLGTILRTSDAIGGAGVIVLGRTADPYDPLCIRASVGAIFSQRVIRSSFDDLIRWSKQHGVDLVGTSPAARTDYRSLQYRTPMVLLMGSERSGLSPDQQAACDALVTIPMIGRSDSLNLAVATGIVLYEMFHQQRVGM